MGLESGTFINDLVETNPVGATDPKSEGDNHLRLIKSVLKSTLPGFAGAISRVQSKSGAYTIVQNDNLSLIRCTASLTLTMTAAATLGNNFRIQVYNDSNGTITFATSGSQTIDGFTSFFLLPFQCCTLFCDGSNFFVLNNNTVQPKNLIFNSGMTVSQEWGDVTGTASSLNSFQYGPDEFKIRCTGVSAFLIFSRDTNVPTPAQVGSYVPFSLKIVNQAAKAAFVATDIEAIVIPIEGHDFQAIAQQPFQFSFWVRTSITGTYSIALSNGGEDRTYVKSFDISAANTWEFKRFLVPASPSAGTWNYSSGTGLLARICLGAGTTLTNTTDNEWTAINRYAAPGQINFASVISSSFGLAAPMIVPGAFRTPYKSEVNTLEVKLKAQRYYLNTYDEGNYPNKGAGPFFTGAISTLGIFVTGDAFFTFPFPVYMRAIPFVQVYNPNLGTGSQAYVPAQSRIISSTVTFVGKDRMCIFCNNAGITSTNQYVIIHAVADARL